MLILTAVDVRRLLPMAECIDVMADVLEALTRGTATLPLRQILWLPERRGALGLMPGHVATAHTVGVKVVSVFPENHGTPYDSHQGAVLLFETDHGQLRAVVDASTITEIRTAAVSGVATRLLARDDASILALLGSGVQARSHLAAMCAVRHIAGVRVWSRTLSHAQRFARREGLRHDVPITVATSVEAAVADADIICTTTSAVEPILHRDWIAPGTHVNAVGSSVAFTRELDTAVVRDARLFVDRRESTLNEAGDFLFAKREGAIDDAHIQGEVGELLTGAVAGRRTRQDITLFKSLGLAVEDIAAARHVYRRAVDEGMGHRVDLDGMHDDD